MNFNQFQATMREENGTLYYFDGTLEILKDFNKYYLIIANCEYEDFNLAKLELILFNWAKDEGYFED